MRTIQITLDTKLCRISLKHIRVWNVDPENMSRIVIWVQGFKSPFYASESVEKFSERYEKAMNELEDYLRNREVQRQIANQFEQAMGLASKEER